jgi:hypothetical protein
MFQIKMSEAEILYSVFEIGLFGFRDCLPC